jgi:DNA-binding protein YbaB
MKKLVTMALTAAMVLSMSVSALANDSASGTVTESGDNGKTTVTTITEVKVGDVTISTASADMTTEEVLEEVIKAAENSAAGTAIQESVKQVVEKAEDKVVAPFVDVQMEEGDRSEDGKFHPTLQNDAIAVKDGKTPRVFGYHLRSTDGKLELVEGTVNTANNTVQFALDSLSPIALVIIYETVQTPAQSPAQTTTQTTPVSSPATSPNTGANESAALLCLVAVVAFGAAAVVTMKPRKRA